MGNGDCVKHSQNVSVEDDCEDLREIGKEQNLLSVRTQGVEKIP